MDPENRTCRSCKGNFTIAPDDFVFYEKIKVPAPFACPTCRQQQRMIFRNFKTLYKRASDRSLKPMISMYSPQAPYKIYSKDEWWADDWDAKVFGRPFDFTRPFFEQFAELFLAVPKFAIMNTNSDSCDYSNFTWNSKSCYLVFGCVDDEECAYGHIVWESKDSLDNLYLHKSELCYDCIDCLGCYRLLYCQECESTNTSIGCFDCRGCTNCIGCVGLKDKSHYIFNEPIGKEGYEKFLADHPLHDTSTRDMILSRQMELRKALPQRHFFGSHNTDVSGNHIYNANDVHDSYDVKGGEYSRFIYTSRRAVDSYDVAFSPDIEQVYNSLTTLKANRVFCCHMCTAGSDLYYCDSCFNARNCFGCAGLKGGEYCVLNRQYSKEDYEILMPKIVEHMKKTGEWGEFFPPKLSPFCYNESIANEYMPLSKGEAIAKGFRWQDELPATMGQETVSSDALPAQPEEYSEKLLEYVLRCDECARNYRFISKEIIFYKQMNLPLPRQCFNCRHARRMKMRNPREVWEGECARCHTAFKTTYNPEQQKEFRIYCESCYQAEVA